jgi:16S rRNA (cytidine1402-2'-O)-methyltransferase
MLAALVVSGLPTDRFHFAGFLPPKQGQRVKLLEAVADQQATLVFYEAPHRIPESLADIASVFGRREIAVARELTKIHEEVLRGTAAEVLAKLRARDSIRGEFVILISKATEPEPDNTPLDDAIEALIGAGVARMEAIKTVARRRGLPKRDVYRLVNRI